MKAVRAFRSVLGAVILGLIAAPTSIGADTVTFSASGDFGQVGSTNVNARAVLDQIAASNSAFHLALGDFSYSTAGSESTWCTNVKSRVGATFPFQLIAGNHDTGERNSAGTAWEAHIDNYVKCLPNRLPGVSGTYGRQWYVDVPSDAPLVRIVLGSPSLDFHSPASATFVEDRYTVGSPGYVWMSNAIDDARARKIPWVIAGVHYPCLTPGNYDCAARFSMGTALMNLFVSKKVDLVLSGHEHLYARTHQLGYATGCEGPTQLRPVKGKDTPSHDPDCIRNRTSNFSQGDGTVFAIVGTGGRPLYDINTADNEIGYFAAWTAQNINPTYGNLMMTATRTRLAATFARASGGTFTDAFTVTRDDGVSPPPPPPDADADGVPDATDLCRLLAGPATRRGCPTTFLGTLSADRITGTGWADTISGLGGNDLLRGLAGNDRILGGPGADTLIGDAGNDTMFGGTGRDTVRAGIGNDTIWVRDRTRDVVYCGLGRDTVVADRIDVLRGCERVTRR